MKKLIREYGKALFSSFRLTLFLIIMFILSIYMIDLGFYLFENILNIISDPLSNLIGIIILIITIMFILSIIIFISNLRD